MNYESRFKRETELIEKYGLDKAHMICAIGLYIDHHDLIQLASEGLTDGNDDKKIDFIRYEDGRLVIAQGHYSDKGFYKSKSNKAADLNTAVAWIFSGDLSKIKDSTTENEASLKDIIQDVRKAHDNEELETIDLLFVNNQAESQNVRDELETAETNLNSLLQDKVVINSSELGSENIEQLYLLKEAAIAIDDVIEIDGQIEFIEEAENWRAGVLSVSGIWLKTQFDKYGNKLFSANYRSFLGISKRGRKKINFGIQNTVNSEPENFWAYNNGITILTTKFHSENKNTILNGISIINGAQTTGALSHSDINENNPPLILARIIESNENSTIDQIVEYNNTQNQITSWDKFSKDPTQSRISDEFSKLGYNYSIKRGFDNVNQDISIEVVAQPTAALHGKFLEAGSGKNKIFETTSLYKDVFQDIKSKHLLLAYCLIKSIDNRRGLLRTKLQSGKATESEARQLSLLKSLRFKYFILSVIGSQFETILGQPIEIRDIAFKNGVAGSNNNSIDELINICSPLINVMIRLVTTKIKNENFSEVMYNKDSIQTIYDEVGNSIEGMKESNPENNVFISFSEFIAPKG